MRQVKTVALFTNARDESKIVEWASHHLLIGFTHIIIFDHKSIIPLQQVFNGFDKRVRIIRVDDVTNNCKIKIYLMNIALTIAKQMQVDWFIYLDADEFIILNNGFYGIKQLLNANKFATSLALNWLMFGSNNLVQEPSGLILDNYIKSDLILNKHVKTFVQPNYAINASSPHFYNMTCPNKMYAINRRLNSNIEGYCFNTYNIEYSKVCAYIAHYANQSEHTYIKRKCLRPRDDTGTFRDVKATTIHDKHNKYINLYPKQTYAENIKKFIMLKQNNTNNNSTTDNNIVDNNIK